MKLSVPIPLRIKLPNTWKRLVKSLKLRLKRPLFIRAFRSRGLKNESRRRKRFNLHWFKSSRDMDRVMKLKSFSDAGYSIKDPFPSPLTPAYVKVGAGEKMEEVVCCGKEIMEEDTMKKFEKYLLEMIVEDGKMTNLADIEEFLHFWKSLKCPVFAALVCRFYGELCMDLFSNHLS